MAILAFGPILLLGAVLLLRSILLGPILALVAVATLLLGTILLLTVLLLRPILAMLTTDRLPAVLAIMRTPVMPPAPALVPGGIVGVVAIQKFVTCE